MNIIIYLYLNNWVISTVLELGQISAYLCLLLTHTHIHTRLRHSDSSVIRFLPHVSPQKAVSNLKKKKKRIPITKHSLYLAPNFQFLLATVLFLFLKIKQNDTGA